MRKNVFIATCLLSLIAISHLASAQVAQPTPMPNTFVHDFAGVLSVEGKARLQASAQQLRDEYKTEIALVTIDSLQGEDSFNYSLRMARSWGIGSKDNDIRGLLILIAIKDHKTAFRTSRHIEGELPDTVTGSISREMNDYFKRGDFDGGLALGMKRILEQEKSVSEPHTVSPQVENSGFNPEWLLLLLIPLGAIPAYFIYHRKKRAVKEALVGAPGSISPQNNSASSGLSAGDENPATPRRDTDVISYLPTILAIYGYNSSTSSGSDDSGSSSSSDVGSSYSGSTDVGSSSNSDSGSSYSGGSDFGGGGSDSSW